MASAGKLPALSNEISECGFRIYAAPDAPLKEFRDVQTPFANLAFVDPRLGTPESLGQVPLSQFCFLTHSPKQRQREAVAWGVLAFGHNPSLRPRDFDSDSLSDF